MREPSIAPAYAFLYPLMCEAARECGYALALHGTMARDLDVVAIPWTDEAASPQDLLPCLLKSVDGFLLKQTSDLENPTIKAHGRMVWTIHLQGPCFIDLSVMPKSPIA